jgi:hypothetical protein
MREQIQEFLVYKISYFPNPTLSESVPIAAIIMEKHLGQIWFKRIRTWDNILSLDPNADTELLAAIVDELESKVRSDFASFRDAEDWSGCIQVHRSAEHSLTDPEKVLDLIIGQ